MPTYSSRSVPRGVVDRARLSRAVGKTEIASNSPFVDVCASSPRLGFRDHKEDHVGNLYRCHTTRDQNINRGTRYFALSLHHSRNIIDGASQTNGVSDTHESALSAEQTKAVEWSPETVLSTIPHPPTGNGDSPVPFFHILERLKTTKRAGWQRFGIEHGESISDHMYRMSILTMLAPPSLTSRLNVPHCTRMALIHDMAEALVGDITPVDGVSKSEKSRRESETMDYLCDHLLGTVPGLSGAEIRKIWQEYEDDKTLEAHFVHDVDKIELLLQMVEYERSHEGRQDLGEFTWVATRIKLPEVKTWADEVFQERKQFWKTIGKEPYWAPA